MRKALFIAALTLMVVPFAFAATEPGTLTVNASVSKTCTIGDATLTFTYDPTAGTNADADTTIAVRCTRGAANVFITLGQGLNAATGSTDAAPARRLLHTVTAGEFLNYNLYGSAALRTAGTVWNNTTGVTYTPATSASYSLPVFGRIPSGQDPIEGSFADSVVATINF